MDKKTLGIILIISGGLVWPIGFWLKFKPFPYIVIPHILLIASGVLLRGSHIVKIIRRRKNL
ncbi:MAG: hypothetical protein A3I04_05420 [Nitrospinae bacterium RIFCSPLOWO2_02_FULL_39_110]|nr:MAG: hypothetical protein A2W53_03630 [Nitrospinae bacterium RIFCSPHIGHO2_02_39_11]OGV98862.1 MAG: hypothetical protein A3D97_06065 [Nitrospinae bacterium RIFCSPHIGHO2_12_FULL_39_42]OGW04840.1 MAG: hypothetical protein A3I04_05420 [Nitrospinae bacterium RIFCSPLOWO2_02_FULL_39_110]OGW05382.1 MAG: hypothetical protein A2Z59_00090 [Nitrospinae bacterium RIFCSPLOWO2_02_39_17]OGW10886.1 MAG: hypothetical protein A2W75_04130 [Nitrospinae bacterium RIFCSPLOWO2_12_39_15]